MPAERVLGYERGGGVDDRLIGGAGMPVELGACFAAVDEPLAAEVRAHHRHLRVHPREQLDDDVGHPARGPLGGLVREVLAKDAGDVSIPEEAARAEETLACGGWAGHREDVQ